MTIEMKTVSRIDKARIVGSIKKDDGGALRGTAIVARAGILTYFENGKTIKELVRPETLAHSDSLESLKMKPVTLDHPSVKLVTPQTYKQYSVGLTGETVNCEDGLLYSSMTINDNAAIQAVDGGKRELSCGYTCDLLEQPGTWSNGERYDREQVNRRYNHVAICDLGRAGSVASLHLDSADVYECGEANFKDIKKTDNTPIKRSRPMPVPVTLKGIVYNDQAPEVAAALSDALATIESVRKDSLTAISAAQTKLDAETAAHVATKTKLDAANAQIAELPGKIAAASKTRAELVATAKPHLDKADQDRVDTLSDAQIKIAVANKAFPAAKETINTVKIDNVDAVDTWYTAALTALKNDQYDAAAAANRAAVGGDPLNPVIKEDTQEQWEAKQLKHDHKGNREQFLKS